MRYLYAGIAGAALLALLEYFGSGFDDLGKAIIGALAFAVPWVIISGPSLKSHRTNSSRRTGH